MPAPAPDLDSQANPSVFSGERLACRRGERLVFRGLDFRLAAGDALILTGPNGSGKSSLLRMMAGLTPPVSGILAWDGVPIGEDPAGHRARLHYVGHSDALKPVLSAAETLAFWARMRGTAAETGRALRQFGLERAAELPCRYLSAGQRRRLALARLLASPAPLWLLDEPLTSLDDEGSAALLAAIAAHRQSGGRVVISTHLALAIADTARLSLADFRSRAAEAAI